MVNYFNKYSSRQVDIVKKWVNENLWLKEIVTDIEEDSTSFHDVKIRTSIDKDRWYYIEVKEDERFWFDKTENIGLDAISSFKIVNNKTRWLPFGNNGAWVKKEHYNEFKKDIQVSKWGKLFTCDADIQLFFVEGKVLKAYNNKLIINEDFSRFVTSNYDLRINNKKKYGINDCWMSAAYFFKPLKDINFIKLEIKDLKDFLDL